LYAKFFIYLFEKANCAQLEAASPNISVGSASEATLAALSLCPVINFPQQESLRDIL
jgi:hypothetical protein